MDSKGGRRFLEPMQALVLTQHKLDELLQEAARQGAALAVADIRREMQQSPEDVTLQSLRRFLQDPASIPNPSERWAHSGIIRQIEPTARGTAKSTAWFMKFQRETGLAGCYTRPSPAYGRRREWSFADIKLAWDAYYRRR